MVLNIPPNVRRIIYVVVAGLLAAMFATGVLTPDQLNVIVDNAVKLLAALAAVLAALNVNDI